MNVEPVESGESFDVIVVGGSFAGLSAAMQIVRARRKVLVVDGGEPRNRFAEASHGFLGQDGKTPAEILRVARDQYLAYPTARFLAGRVTKASGKTNEFLVETESGERFGALRLVLATGVAEGLLEVEGLWGQWGRGVFHCPYCHGYEVAGRPLGVLGGGAMAVHKAILLTDWSDEVTVYSNGAEVDAEGLEKLARFGIGVDRRRIQRLVEGKVLFEDGSSAACGGMMATTLAVPAGDLHTQLGCRVVEGRQGWQIEVSEARETSVAGVFAAGDAVLEMHSVALAVAEGALAGGKAHQSLVFEGVL